MPKSGRKSSVALLLLVAVSVVLTGAAVQIGLSSTRPTGSPVQSQSGLTPDDITLGNAIATACVDVDTCTTPALTDVGAGDTLIVIVTEHTTTNGNPSSVVEVTSGGDNAMTLLGSSGCTVLGHGVVAIYGLADVAAQASVTFTVTYAEDAYYTVHALDVEGAAASPFETAGTPVCSSAAGTTASASVTTTVADDLVILGVEVRADESISASGGDTVVTLEEIGGTDSDSGSMLYESDSGTGSITLSATFGSAQWAALAIALKPGLIAGVVSPTSAAIDASQTVALTSTAASGGVGPYTYQWYTGSATCSSGTAISGATSLTYTTPALPVGTDYYCVEVTDTSTGQVAYSNVAIITVNPALSVAIIPASPSIDNGQAITLTADPSGGTGPDAYTWYLGTSCTGTPVAATQAYTTASLASSTTYCVAATDSSLSPETATANDTVTVSAAALSVTITPSSPSIDDGQSITLTANPSGGTGADTYVWYSGGTCSGPVLATAPSYTTSALGSTTTYCVAVTDSAYQPVTATATDTVTVSGTSLSVTITPSGPSIDSGQNVTLTANPSGGTGADSYAWYAGSACSGTVLATTEVYTTADLESTSTFCVAVTDSAYQPATATTTDLVTVSALPLSVTITPASPSIDSGQTITLTANPSGGTGADDYAWYAGSDCAGTVLGTSQSFTTPSLTLTSTYCVAVTDSAYQPVTANATDTVTVSGTALSVSITPASPSIDRGQTIQLTATASGGTPPDAYVWYADASCSGTTVATTQSYTTLALSVTSTFCVQATDSGYEPQTATATDTVTVSSAALSVVVNPASPSIDSGQTITLTATPSGGTGADSYAWYVGTSCSGPVLGTAQSYETAALTASTSYCLAATDSAFEPVRATATDTVTVSSSTLAVSILPESPSIDSGQSVMLTAHPSGGTGADTYAWYAGSTCSGTVLARTQAYASGSLTATSTYCVAATDSAYQPVTATATDTVTVSSAPLSVTITPASPSIKSGQTVTLTAVPVGGTGADTYAWYAGSSCSGPVLATTQSYSTAALSATESYCVSVTDSSSEPATAMAAATVTVTAATHGGSGTGGGSGLIQILGSDWWLLLLLVIVVLFLVLVVGRRRRKKEPPAPVGGNPAAPAAGAGVTGATVSSEPPTSAPDAKAPVNGDSSPEGSPPAESGTNPPSSEPSAPAPAEPDSAPADTPSQPAAEPEPSPASPGPAPAEPEPAPESPAPVPADPSPNPSPEPGGFGDWMFDAPVTDRESQE